MIHAIISLLFLINLGLFANTNDLSRLIEGNQRFINGNLTHPNRTDERREATVSKQEPFAVIVSCSDSRVSPEIIFDEGIGDLFVVRLAGNVIDSVAKESIVFAVKNLHSSIILVLGHENCGAVNAVLQKQIKDIPKIAALISPFIKKIKSKKNQNNLKDAIKANAIGIRNKLAKDKNFKKLIAKKRLQIFPGYYNLKSGVVEVLDF